MEAKDVVVKELQEQLNSTVHALENTRSELEKLAQQRDTEFPDQLPKNGPAKEQAEGSPRPDRKGMNSKLLELGAAKARAASSLQPGEAKHASENDQGVFLTDENDVLETDDKPKEGPSRQHTKTEKNS